MFWTRRSVVTFLVGCVSIARTPVRVFAQDPNDAGESVAKDRAQKADDHWLALVDAGRWPESWKEASTAFRAAVSETKWVQGVTGVREPLGKLLHRTLASAAFSTHLPGVPDGQYVVTQYRTAFEHKAEAVETVVAQLDTDSSWRVSGYYVH